MSEEMSHHNRQKFASFMFSDDGEPHFLGELYSKKACYFSVPNVSLDGLVKQKGLNLEECILWAKLQNFLNTVHVAYILAIDLHLQSSALF